MNGSVQSGMQVRGRVEASPRRAQCFLQLELFADGRGALQAAAQMGGELLLRPWIELIIHIQGDFVSPVATHGFPPALSERYSRICFRARARRDMTVPIGIFSVSATSWYFISSTSTSSSTS